MRGIKFTIGLIICLFSTLAFSQNIRVEGVVRDAKGNGLDMANVIAINAETKAMANFVITDPKGNYHFSLPVNQTYELKVSFIGFDSRSILLDLNGVEETLVKNIVLEESSEKLEEVEITYEMPITIKGDTIVYNSDSFRNGTEQKLGDVLEKLPGVEVNDDGEVEIEGKKVTKVMVEGKDFFDGDSKVAVQNIPANALDKIEVLRNYSEVGQMKGVTNNEDNIALNIRLKKGKDKFWFGEVSAGAGPDERYTVNPKVFYYSPKTSVNLLTNANNIGQVPFTVRDYYRFTGGLRGNNFNGGTNLNVGNNAIGLSTMQNNRANEVKTLFGASNFSFNPNDKVNFSGFGIYSSTDTEMIQNSTRTFLENNATENINEKTTQSSKLSLMKLSTSYKPDLSLQIDYDAFLKLSKQEELGERLSIINTNSNDIYTNKNDDPYEFSQSLNVYKTLNSKNIVSFEVQHLLQKERPFENSISDDLNIKTFITPPLVEETGKQINLSQAQTTFTDKFDAKVNYYYLLSSKSHLNFTLGTLLTRQNFDSNLFQILDNGSQNNFTSSTYTNDVTFGFTDLYSGFHYKFIEGNFTFEPGVFAHYYRTVDKQLNTKNRKSFTRFLPDFYARYQFKSSESIRFRYRMTTQFTDVNNLAEGVLFNNYNALFRGNRNLENALYHTYSLSYFNFVMYNYTNINASINYTKKDNPMKNNTVFSSVGQNTTPQNSNLPDETLSANFRYGRTFRKIKVNLRSSGSYNKTYNFRNNSLDENEVYSYSYGGNIGTNFNKAPNVKIGFTQSINDYTDRIFFTNRPYINVDAAFLKHFIFSADYSYYDYHDKEKTITNTYAFLSADLRFRKKENPWEFRLSGTNLLNTKSLNRDNINTVANSVTTLNYFVQPRFLMFTVQYNL